VNSSSPLILPTEKRFGPRRTVELFATTAEMDPAARRQPLLAVYDRAALAAALVDLGEPAGRSMRALVAGLDVVEVAAVGNEALDCDTWVEVSRSTLLLSEEGT